MGVEITTELERQENCGCLIHVEHRPLETVMSKVEASVAGMRGRHSPYRLTVEPCRQHTIRVLSASNAMNRDALIRAVMEAEFAREDL